MNDASLFHAYVIGGSRENARAHVAEMLGGFESVTETLASFVSEHVTFSIDNARELRAWQELLPDTGTRKVYIVYANFITREAENALLKTLEEPVERTHIIFAVPNPEQLLPTLRSRVRIVIPAVAAGSREREREEAKTFLALSRAERLKYAAKIVEKSDDDDAAAEVRERTLALLDSLEEALALDMEKNRKKLSFLLRFKKYLYIPGASSRIILETLALTL